MLWSTGQGTLHSVSSQRLQLFFDTILPRLFLMRSPLARPPAVFTLYPAKTFAFARGPAAIFDTFIAFLFIAGFITFMAFIPFMAVFMAFIAFMAFMAAFFAMKKRRERLDSQRGGGLL